VPPTTTTTTTTAAARRRARIAQEPEPVGAPTPEPTVITTSITPPRLSDVIADLIFEPVFGFRFRGTAAFDPYETRVSSATTDVYYEAERWRAGFGTRHGDNGELAFIQAYVQARLGRRWALRFSTDYNVDTSTVIENRFELDFWEQCWGVSAAFIDRSNEDEFRVTVNLLELGQYGFGRAFAGFQ
jgi:hypothetical protein